jgi:hypothetical protein
VWYDLVTAGWPANYTTATVTANGASSYLLASGAAIMGVRNVYRVDGDRRVHVPRLDESDKAAVLAPGVTNARAYEVLVGLTGTVVRLYPSSVSGSYEVEYLAEPLDFTNDADTWAGPGRSDQLICLQAAAKGCRKESRRADAADLLSDYRTLLERVIATAAWVDLRNPARIRDTNTPPLGDGSDFDVYRGDY